MLSIGKLAAGQEAYYLSEVAQGVEDYYLGAGEAPGRWRGAGPAALELDGEVAAEDLRAVLAGRAPGGGRLNRARVPGFDLTFSAPKSVSLLYALGGEAASGAVVAAHEAAVDAGLAYMERHATFTRRRLRRVRGQGLVVAGFRHRTSRAGDPQLHTHCLVANLVRGVDGGWGALDARLVYRHARTAGFVYQAVMRGELTARLGVGWGPVRNGYAEVAGADRAVLRGFSRRRVEIEQQLEQRGLSSPAAAQAATLDTRAAKDYGVDPGSLAGQWWARASELGVTPATITGWMGRAEPAAVDVGVVVGELVSPRGLTLRRASFDRRDATRGVCEALPSGAPATVGMLERLTDEVVAHRDVVALQPNSGTAKAGLFSTVEMLEVERRLTDLAVQFRTSGAGVAPSAVVEGVGGGLAGEQAAMVRRLCRAGAGVEVVVGAAGTGKTTALAAARRAWQAGGFTVSGCALAARAARELEDGSGIPSMTLARLLADLDAEPCGVGRGSVVVVDEAGMVDTRRLGRLAERVVGAGGKLVLVGDHRQLPEVEAGGAFGGLAARLAAVELVENRRQHHRWERDALAELRTGDPAKGLETYGAQGRVVVADAGGEARDAMVEDWLTARRADERVLMVAVSNRSVEDLNQRARRRLVDAGVVAGDQLVVDGTAFGVGDEVLCLRNDRRLGLLNGTTGTVTLIDPDAGTMAIDVGDRTVVIPKGYVADHVAHGYAVTVHKAQGATVDRCFVLADDLLYREAGYVALSRGRASNQLYITSGDHDDDTAHVAPADDRPNPGAEVAAALGRSRAQTMASDQQRHPETVEQSLSRLWAQRDALAARLAASQLKPAPVEGAAPGGDVEDLAARLALAIQQREAAEETVAATPKRQWRRHRQARAELVAATSLEQATATVLADAEATRATLERSHSGLEEWRAAHPLELRRLAQLDDAIASAEHLAGRRAAGSPSPRILAALGSPPTSAGPALVAWQRAAGAIASFDARSSTGTSDAGERVRHAAAVAEAVADARHVTAAGVEPVRQVIGIER